MSIREIHKKINRLLVNSIRQVSRRHRVNDRFFIRIAISMVVVVVPQHSVLFGWFSQGNIRKPVQLKDKILKRVR